MAIDKEVRIGNQTELIMKSGKGLIRTIAIIDGTQERWLRMLYMGCFLHCTESQQTFVYNVTEADMKQFAKNVGVSTFEFIDLERDGLIIADIAERYHLSNDFLVSIQVAKMIIQNAMDHKGENRLMEDCLSDNYAGKHKYYCRGRILYIAQRYGTHIIPSTIKKEVRVNNSIVYVKDGQIRTKYGKDKSNGCIPTEEAYQLAAARYKLICEMYSNSIQSKNNDETKC